MTAPVKYQSKPVSIPHQNRALTRQEEHVEHMLSEDQLGAMEMHHKDPTFQIFLLCLGGVFGAAAPALQEINILLSEESANFTFLSLVECIVFFGSIVGAAVTFLIRRTNSKNEANIFEAIRKRTKHRLSEED